MWAVALLLGLGVVAGVGWIGSEMHYENCLDKARAQNPLTLTPRERSTSRLPF